MRRIRARSRGLVVTGLVLVALGIPSSSLSGLRVLAGSAPPNLTGFSDRVFKGTKWTIRVTANPSTRKTEITFDVDDPVTWTCASGGREGFSTVIIFIPRFPAPASFTAHQKRAVGFQTVSAKIVGNNITGTYSVSDGNCLTGGDFQAVQTYAFGSPETTTTPAVGGRVLVTPVQVAPGGRVTITGTGWGSSAAGCSPSVRLKAYAVGTNPASASTIPAVTLAGKGSFTLNWVTPKVTGRHTWIIRAEQQCSKIAPIVHYAYIVIG